MKKRKITTWFALLFLVTFAFLGPISLTVNADTGPKPSIDLEVINAPKDYYVALLGKRDWDTGHVNSHLKLDSVSLEKVEEYLENFWYKGWHYFESPLGDNLYRRNETDVYHFWYMVPKPFRVLLIDMDGNVYVSDELYQWEYNAECTFDFHIGSLIEHRAGAVGKRILIILCSYLITLAIELLILRAFYPLNKNNLFWFWLTNTVTNIPLNIFLLHTKLGLEITFIWFFLEILIVFVEGFLYAIFLKNHKGKKRATYALGYSALANFLSAFVGVMIQMIYYSLK